MMRDDAQAQLQRWGLNDATAQAAGLFSVDSAAAIYKGMSDLPAIVIPYWNIDGTIRTYQNGAGSKPFARLRLLASPLVGGFNVKPTRYLQPGHSGVHVYFPPIVDWRAVAADPSIPIVITEGEAKALAACAAGFTCFALGGVFNFNTPGGRLLPEFESFMHPNRNWYIAFDSDAATNPNVVAAEARLVQQLQIDRGMRTHIVRLPPATNEEKTGLDDFLRTHGADAFERLLSASKALSPLDARIVAMNKRYAWIDAESMVFNMESRQLIRKESFLNGSLSSSETFPVPYKDGMKLVPLAPKWLTHIHAQRYSEVLFRPGESDVIPGSHGPALNLWDGWGAHEPGDVTPWLRLNDFLFQYLQPELRDFALKLMAFKAQNPASKTAICPVLIGDQGTGKTIWTDCIADAFSPMSVILKPSSLYSEYQDWLERTVFAATHELSPEEMGKHYDTIKAMISDKARLMNVKFRPIRQVLAYQQYVITSNHRGVGAHAADDRRFFVVDTPGVGADSLYDDVWNWRDKGGGKHLLHYLLNFDLQGWKPPKHAPLTAGKVVASAESRTVIEQLAVDMKKGDSNFIMRCWDMALQWAQGSEGAADTKTAGHARAIAAAAKSFPIRPWYTGDELAMLLPFALEVTQRGFVKKGTLGGEVSRLLRDCGIRYLINRDYPEGFIWRGQMRQFLVIAEPQEWADPISQAEFDRLIGNFPTYSQLRSARR